MNVWGTKLKLTIFGESHGDAIGAVIDGIPAGLSIDMEFINREMIRRAPGHDKFSTPRNETDKVEILSGVFEGKTCGTPICGIIRNTNTRSKDYTPEFLRPGHADYTGFLKHGENHDFRGGGHFSGRITAGLVFAGAIAKLYLEQFGTHIGSHIKNIHGICEDSFEEATLTPEMFESLSQKDFPTINDEIGKKMQKEILDAAADGDSVGGIIECGAIGVEKGKGSPFFASLESLISSLVFSIPAVKGIEFGSGFDFANMYGSVANDPFETDGKNIYTTTNHNAGINGGISNGMPIVFSTVIKPTPSISKVQNTVDKSKMENTTIQVHGRHDPCILKRAAVVVESAMAIALAEAYML